MDAPPPLGQSVLREPVVQLPADLRQPLNQVRAGRLIAFFHGDEQLEFLAEPLAVSLAPDTPRDRLTLSVD